MKPLYPIKAKLKEADPINRRHVYESTKGNLYELVEDKKRFFLKEGVFDTIKGTIWPKGFYGGAIMFECQNPPIAEYEKAEWEYRVIPIEEGELKHQKEQRIHPIDYLIEYIEKGA